MMALLYQLLYQKDIITPKKYHKSSSAKLFTSQSGEIASTSFRNIKIQLFLLYLQLLNRHNLMKQINNYDLIELFKKIEYFINLT